MKKVSGTAKLDLAQYYELEAFSQFASELDEATKAKLTRGRRVVEALKQKQNNPYALWQEVIVLYAASKGFLDPIEASEVGTKIKELFATVETNYSELVAKIETEKSLSEEIETGIKELMTKFFG
jgi:F-type H+-transporting ATPase subunit alpha